MKKDTQDMGLSPAKLGMTLEDLLREGARDLIEQAVSVELSELLAGYENSCRGQQAVVRNGYLPERELVTPIGPVGVRIPKVRDRSGGGVKFNSALVPPYVRRSRSLSAALPWLYLKGISTGEMSTALEVLVGEGAKGLSPSVVSRLKAQWGEEYSAWMKRDLSQERYVYWWVDGIYSSLRSEDERLCLLVVIGVLPTGEKRFVAISNGFRESAESWKTLLRELKDKKGRGSLLAMGRWDSGRRLVTRTQTPVPNAAGCTRRSTCSIVCRNRCKRRPSRNCRPFGWRRRARAPIRPLTASFAPTRRSI